MEDGFVLLGGDTVAPSGLYARLYHAFLVYFSTFSAVTSVFAFYRISYGYCCTTLKCAMFSNCRNHYLLQRYYSTVRGDEIDKKLKINEKLILKRQQY